MLELTGTICNIFKTAAGVGKDGKSYDEKDRVQLLGEMSLPNGGVKVELVNLSVDDVTPYLQFEDKRVRVPVGVMGGNGRTVTFFVRKGSKPVLA